MSAAHEKTFVKICGITRLSDARVAIRAGANALGFVFAPSPRRVSAARAAGIATHVHPAVRKIGVFVDAGWDRIIEMIDAVGLDGVQLHGDESQEFVDELKSARRNLFITKVFRPINNLFADEVATFNSDAVLLDSKDVRDPGTSGPRIPAELLQSVKAKKVVVAGGLTPENVGEVIRQVHPWGVDVSGGVESELGKKSPEKVREFVRAVRQAEAV